MMCIDPGFYFDRYENRVKLSYLIRDRLVCLTGNFFGLDAGLRVELELKRLRKGDRLYVDTTQSLE
jgi:hypothetical protein